MSSAQVERRPNAGRWLRLAGTLISSGLFLWLLLRQDWASIWKNLQLLSGWVILFAFCLYILGQVANALRWHILLRAQAVQIGFFDALKIVFAGAFVSNFLPSTIGGDTVRLVSVRRYAGGWVVSAASVVVDRLLNVLAMLTTVPFSLVTFWPQVTHWLSAGGSALAAQSFFTRGKLGRAWRSGLRQLGDALRLWRGQPGQLGLAFIVSWLSIFVIFLAVWLIARGLGIRVALYQVMGVNAITYLLTLLPISINGYGVREIAMATLYTELGASLEQAATLSLITRFFMLIETLPGGIWLAQIQPAGGQPEKAAGGGGDNGVPLG